MKNYAETRWRAKSSSLPVKDTVLIRQPKQQILYKIWPTSLQGSKKRRFNGNSVPRWQVSHTKCLPVQGSENGVQQTTVDPKESDDDSDNDTGDTQPDARTQSDPRTTAPALPAAPRTIMLSFEKT